MPRIDSVLLKPWEVCQADAPQTTGGTGAALPRRNALRQRETISRQAESIDKEVGAGEKKLGKLLDDTKKTLTALNVELCDEELERACPIEVDAEAADGAAMIATRAGE